MNKILLKYIEYTLLNTSKKNAFKNHCIRNTIRLLFAHLKL